MTEAARSLVALSVAVAAGDAARLAAAIDRVAAAADPIAAEEVLIQSYLFLGFPAALNALAMWRERTGRAPAQNVADDWDAWIRRGEVVCGRVYGGQYERLRANVAALHPDLDRWMVTEGYGKVLARPGLQLALRELCILALLAVLDAPRQLHSHLRGALNAGASAGDVEEALAIAWGSTSAGRRRLGEEIWAQVRARAASGPWTEQPGGYS